MSAIPPFRHCCKSHRTFTYGREGRILYGHTHPHYTLPNRFLGGRYLTFFIHVLLRHYRCGLTPLYPYIIGACYHFNTSPIKLPAHTHSFKQILMHLGHTTDGFYSPLLLQPNVSNVLDLCRLFKLTFINRLTVCFNTKPIFAYN